MISKDIFNPDDHDLIDRHTYVYGGNNHAATGIMSSQSGAERSQMVYDAVGNMIESVPTIGSSSPEFKDGAAVAKRMEYDSFNRMTRATDISTDEDVGRYWYDDQGFRVRKTAKRTVNSEERIVEVLYPSMYFGFEKQKTAAGVEIPDTTYMRLTMST